MGTGRLAGHYFNVLGTTVILGMIASLILGDPLVIDLTFILYFFIGMGLLDGRPWSRIVGLILVSLGCLAAVGFLVSLLWATGPVSGVRNELRTPLLAAISGVIILILMIPPLVLLLLPGTRRWFAEQRVGPPTRYLLSTREIAVYVLAACVPVAGANALAHTTQTATPSGYSASFDYGERKTGMMAVQWMEDKATRRVLHISWLAFAESNSYGSPRDGHISFGPHRVAITETQPVRYIGSPPGPDESGGNVLLMRENGSVIRLARRVTPEKLESAREAARGVRDFEELRERLEKE